MKGSWENMVILIDTNIFLDIYENRKEFIEDSSNALKLAYTKSARLYFSCSSITDFHYNLSKSLHSKEKAKELVADLIKRVSLAQVDGNCIYSAITSKMKDFEDAVIDAVAVSIDADYILTRNKKDFEHSRVKAITPKEFLSL